MRHILGYGGKPSPSGVATLAYGTTVTPDSRLGAWHLLTVTNTTAFRIANPLNPPSAAQSVPLIIEVLNSSGGVMGTVTWGSVASPAFVFPTGAWVNPASTKKRFARFEWNGSLWICTGPATSDY